MNTKISLTKAVAVLKAGGVVMHPTETCYGLAVDIFNRSALRKLYAVKGRDFNKPVSILVNSLEMALEYGVFGPKALELAGENWPGPFSIVVPRGPALPEFLNPGEDFVSIRWSSEGFCSELVREFGGPITTTSANLAGDPPLYEPAKLEGVDFLVDGGVLSGVSPSRVVKVDGESLVILR